MSKSSQALHDDARLAAAIYGPFSWQAVMFNAQAERIEIREILIGTELDLLELSRHVNAKHKKAAREMAMNISKLLVRITEVHENDELSCPTCGARF